MHYHFENIIRLKLFCPSPVILSYFSFGLQLQFFSLVFLVLHRFFSVVLSGDLISLKAICIFYIFQKLISVWSRLHLT